MFYEDIIQKLATSWGKKKKKSCHSLSLLSPQPKGEKSEAAHVNALLLQGAFLKLQNCSQSQQQ